MRSERLVKNPFFLVYVYAFLLLVGVIIPDSDIEKLQEFNKIFSIVFSDKSFHFFGFGILAWLLCYGYHKAKLSRKPYVRAGVFALTYGMFIELVQILLPYRYFSMVDFSFDAAGILVGLVVFYIFERKM